MQVTKKIIRFIAIYTVTTACFSCGNKQSQLFYNPKNATRLSTSPDIPKKIYHIQPYDLLQIRNLQNRKYIVQEPLTLKTQTSPSEGETYEVEADSTIGLPILGRIKIAGLSRTEAARHIEMLYKKEMKDPIIAVKIINLKVTVLGEVKLQGTYTLSTDHTSVVELIGLAGGLTDKGNSKNIKIIRSGPKAQQVLEVNLRDIQTLSDPGIILQNKDIIYVAKNKKTIQSEKLQNIAAILQPVISLLNTAWIIHTLTR
jgi:polysaccharide export outer membrane protein